MANMPLVIDKYPKLTQGFGFHLEGNGFWSVLDIPDYVLSGARFSGYLKIDGYESSVFEMPDGDQWAQKQAGSPEPRYDETIENIITSKIKIDPNLQKSLKLMYQEMILANIALDKAIQYGRRLETEPEFEWIMDHLTIVFKNFNDFKKSTKNAISYALPELNV